MSTRDIRPSLQHTICDWCGRTLLRGEHAEVYLDGGERRWVCDLCVPRALEDGWVREGTAPPVSHSDYGRDRRRPLRQLFRTRRRPDQGDDELAPPPVNERPAPEPSYTVYSPGREAARETPREPRHVHAVPASPDQKMSSAIKAFNGSEHTRTVAGVARSLGHPLVTVKPSESQPAVVSVVAAWELCWYRYEIDLADEAPSVRVAAQGSELEELEADEREGNARANEDGRLALG